MFTFHLEASSIPELMSKAETFFGVSINKPAVVVTDAVEIKGKPGRPSKPKMEETIAANTAAALPAQPVPVAPVVSDPFTAADPTAPGGAPAVTFDQVKSALQKLAVLREGEKDPQVGYNRVGAIISKFGVDKVKNLKPEQYAAVLEACGQA